MEGETKVNDEKKAEIFSKKTIAEQLAVSRKDIERYIAEIRDRSERLEQTKGLISYLEHVQAHFEVPEGEADASKP